MKYICSILGGGSHQPVKLRILPTSVSRTPNKTFFGAVQIGIPSCPLAKNAHGKFPLHAKVFPQSQRSKVAVVATGDKCLGRFMGINGQILEFPSPAGYMLSSFGFSLLVWSIHSIDSSKMIGNLHVVLNLYRLFLKP